jgi:hypothetical protein
MTTSDSSDFRLIALMVTLVIFSPLAIDRLSTGVSRNR